MKGRFQTIAKLRNQCSTFKLSGKRFRTYRGSKIAFVR